MIFKDFRKKKYKFKPLSDRDINLVRQIHITLLAKPKDVRLQPWPNPQLEQSLPVKVSEAAMKAKPSMRTIMLYKSKKMYVEGKKYEPPPRQEHYVEPGALSAVASTRILKLSKPKKLKKIQKKISKRKLAKMKKKFQKFKKEREEWLKSRAAPKKIKIEPLPLPEPEIKPKPTQPPLTPLQRFEKLYFLSLTPAWKMKKPPPKKKIDVEDLLPVSDRLREIALPRRVPSEVLRNMKYRPGVIKRNALRAVASERTKQLAVARPRSKAVETDIREDAFTVSPTALTYKPSRRIIELAKPRIRK